MPIDRKLPHTIWWYIHNPEDPVPAPFQAQMDTADEAEALAKNYVENRNDPYNALRWVKVFRTGNESYQTWRWVNPEPYNRPEPIRFLEEQEPKKRRFKLFSRWGK